MKKQIENLKLQNQLDKISRFLHTTSEPFDNWFWDGNNLEILLNAEAIERYGIEDLSVFISDFSNQ